MMVVATQIDLIASSIGDAEAEKDLMERMGIVSQAVREV
jgi:hypothetical protein